MRPAPATLASYLVLLASACQAPSVPQIVRLDDETIDALGGGRFRINQSNYAARLLQVRSRSRQASPLTNSKLSTRTCLSGSRRRTRSGHTDQRTI